MFDIEKNQQTLLKINSDYYFEKKVKCSLDGVNSSISFLYYEGSVKNNGIILPQLSCGLLFVRQEDDSGFFALNSLSGMKEYEGKSICYVGMQCSWYDCVSFTEQEMKELCSRIGAAMDKKLCLPDTRMTDRQSVLTDYIRNFAQVNQADDNCRAFIQKIIESGGKLHVDKLAEMYDYSVRHVNRIFNKQMHIGPKQYGRRIRIRLTIDRMIENPEGDVTNFMEGFAYSDQAHFQREFKWYMGITPKQFLLKLKKPCENTGGQQ